jgi:hypothetical protein
MIGMRNVKRVSCSFETTWSDPPWANCDLVGDIESKAKTLAVPQDCTAIEMMLDIWTYCSAPEKS